MIVMAVIDRWHSGLRNMSPLASVLLTGLKQDHKGKNTHDSHPCIEKARAGGRPWNFKHMCVLRCVFFPDALRNLRSFAQYGVCVFFVGRPYHSFFTR